MSGPVGECLCEAALCVSDVGCIQRDGGGLILCALASCTMHMAAELTDRKKGSPYLGEKLSFLALLQAKTDFCAVPMQAVPRHPPVHGTYVCRTRGSISGQTVLVLPVQKETCRELKDSLVYLHHPLPHLVVSSDKENTSTE